MKTIIGVDDSRFYLKIVESILKKKINDPESPESAYRFEFIDDPVKAVVRVKEIIQKEEIIMIISDYNMPVLDGLAFLKKIKPVVPNAKLMLLTENSELDTVIHALNSNLLDRFMLKHQIKSGDDADFVECVKNLLFAYQMERMAEDQKKKMTTLVESQRHQLIQADRMASVGTMAAGVAHEINNPLSIAVGDMHMIRRDIKDLLKMVKRYLEAVLQEKDSKEINELKEEIDLDYLIEKIDEKPSRCEGAMKRIQQIVKSLRTFTNLETGDLAAIDISESLNSAITLLPAKHKDKVEIVTEFADLPKISCYGREINQVFMSILLNACQAMNGVGVLKIKTALEGDEDVVIQISDTGPGVPEENLKRIFEPFFTTKPVGEGAGLGLSTSHAALEKHGGDLTVANNADKGATFTIKLPKKE